MVLILLLGRTFPPLLPETLDPDDRMRAIVKEAAPRGIVAFPPTGSRKLHVERRFLGFTGITPTMLRATDRRRVPVPGRAKDANGSYLVAHAFHRPGFLGFLVILRLHGPLEEFFDKT